MNDVTQRKVLGFISLCRRAGRLTTGMDAAVEKAEKGEAHLLLLAQDLSPRSAARLRQKLPDIPVRCRPSAAIPAKIPAFWRSAMKTSPVVSGQ